MKRNQQDIQRTSPWRHLVAVGLVLVVGVPALADAPRPASDDQIKALIAKAGDAKDYDNADFVVVLDEADVYVQESGLATTEACQVIKILTDAGVKAQSVRRWEFDPDTYRVAIRSIRIHREDGSIDDVDVDALLTNPAPQHMIYWGNQQHILSLPRLHVGDCLEIRTGKIGFNIAYLHEDPSDVGGQHLSAGGLTTGGEALSGEGLIPPMAGHWYEVTLFQGHHPIVSKRYSVHMPKDMPVQYEVYNGSLRSSLWFDDEYDVYTWYAEDMPAAPHEPRMVALDDFVPKLVMATLEDWYAKSRWFEEANQHQFDANDEIRAKVAEITEGLTTDQEKIAAVVHWSADNIRYCGTKRGPEEGYTLHTGIETFRDRAGVCKDKAGMAVTMLRVLGFETFPALTMAGSRVERIPADQFNHTVTVIRHSDGSFQILDPTWVPLCRDLWSSLEAEQGLVYGTPEGEDLTLSPYYEPSYNRRKVVGDSSIGEDGTLSTKIVYSLDGSACGRARRKIHGFAEWQKRGGFEHDLNIAPNARLDRFTHTGTKDYSRDTRIELDVTAEGYAAGDGGVRMFQLPLMKHPLNPWFRTTFFDYAKSDERKTGMRFWWTQLIQYEETIQLPPGWKVVNVPEKKSTDSPSASMSFEAEPGDGVLTYRFEIALKKGVVPAEDYKGFKEAIDMMNEIASTWIVCTTGHEDRVVSTTGSATRTFEEGRDDL